MDEAEALPNHITDVLEHFGEVATALPLNDDGGHEECEILAFEADGHFTEAFIERLTQAVLVVLVMATYLTLK